MSPTGVTMPPEFAAGRRRRSAGLALVLVLHAMALLGLVTAGFLAVTRAEMRSVAAQIDASHARAVADGGLEWATAMLFLDRLAEGDLPALLPLDGRPVRVDLPDGAALVAVRDVGGLVDLNGSGVDLLAGLIAVMEVDAVTARGLAERILDYRDADDRPEAGGAETADYAAAGLAWPPKNAPFERVDEIRQIPGIDAALAERLEPFLTVHNGSGGIDPRVAPAPVLAAVPGLDEISRARFSEADPGADFAGETGETGGFLVASQGSILRITVLGESADGGRFIREATVSIGGGGQAFRLIDFGRGFAFEPGSEQVRAETTGKPRNRSR